MTGWYLMHRGWQDSEVFAKEPFTEREAWEWLIGEATYDSRVINLGGIPVKLQRGELTHSVRHMADKMRWSKSKISRFLEKLEKWEMIKKRDSSGTESGTGQSIITICNYEQYQDMRDSSGTATEAKAGQQRDSSGTIYNQVNQDNEVKEPPKSPKGDFEGWWKLYPHKIGKGGAEKAYAKAIRTATPEQLLGGLRRYIETKPPDRPYCNPATWLNQSRWLDEPNEVKNETAHGSNKKYHPNRALELALADQTYAHLRGGGGDYRADAPALPGPTGGEGRGDYF